MYEILVFYGKKKPLGFAIGIMNAEQGGVNLFKDSSERMCGEVMDVRVNKGEQLCRALVLYLTKWLLTRL